MSVRHKDACTGLCVWHTLYALSRHGRMRVSASSPNLPQPGPHSPASQPPRSASAAAPPGHQTCPLRPRPRHHLQQQPGLSGRPQAGPRGLRMGRAEKAFSSLSGALSGGDGARDKAGRPPPPAHTSSFLSPPPQATKSAAYTSQALGTSKQLEGPPASTRMSGLSARRR